MATYTVVKDVECVSFLPMRAISARNQRESGDGQEWSRIIEVVQVDGTLTTIELRSRNANDLLLDV